MTSKRVAIRKTANSNTQREINVSVVYNFVREHGPTYRAEIARALLLSAPGVSRAVGDLLDAGFVTEEGTIVTDGGKRVAAVEVDPAHARILAIDLMKGELKLGFYDFAGCGEIVHTGRDLANESDIGGVLISEVERWSAETGFNLTGADNRLLIGLGVAAAVDPQGSGRLDLSITPDLASGDVAAILREHFDARVYVENDIKLAAFAEHRFGHGRGHRNLVYLDINNGVGTGIIIDDQIIRGMSGYAGEIGFARTSADSLRSDIANGTTLEQSASLEAIEREARRLIDAGVWHYDGTIGTPADVFAAACGSDTVALSIIETMVARFSIPLISLILILNPELVVVGGDIFDMPGVEELFLRPIQEILADALPFNPPPLRFSALGSDACVRGAALLALDRYTTEHYPFSVDER